MSAGSYPVEANSENGGGTFANRMTRIETLLVNLHEKVDTLSKAISDHDEALYGKQDKTGLIGRVEALEVQMLRQNKLNERVVTISLGVIGTIGTYLMLRILGIVAP